MKKTGFLCEKGRRPRYYANIEINGDLHYDKKNKLVYNVDEEEDKLYMAQPCVYTDALFDTDGFHNSYHRTYLYRASRSFPKKYKNVWLKVKRNPKDWGRKNKTLKSAIRTIRNVKGIPKGTHIEICNNYYFRNKDGNPSPSKPTFVYVHDGANSGKPDYKVSLPEYSDNFTSDVWGNELIAELRKVGFIVKVEKSNPHILIGDESGEVAIAFGFNKMIGISSFDNTLHGYRYACENILYDYRGYFNKWSQALQIPKTETIENIVSKLVTETKLEAYGDDGSDD